MAEELMVAGLGLARDELAGQVAVVTGAGRGIGREAARALAYLGATVVAAELDEQAGRETAALVEAAGGRALYMRTDVADEASVAALAARVLAELGRVDVLVNNAVYCPVAPFTETEPALWDRVLAVNLRGTYLMCRAFLPAMLEQGSGTIVNMTSSGDMPGLSAYYASKHGIEGLSCTLASEVGARGVRVIAFGPGMVDTPAMRGAAPRLAPLLGMSEAQFLAMSMHPAYEGLMPAADAGAATAYLVARLAGEYHGEVVDGYTVLERAGYLKAPAVGAAAPTAPAVPTAAGAPGRARELAAELVGMIAETEDMLGRLPVFVRPLARSGFRRKAGQSVEAWARTAEELAARLERVEAGDAGARAQLRAGLPQLTEMLDRLAAYFQGEPAEAARFTRDEAFLRQAAETAATRVAAIAALAPALREVAGTQGSPGAAAAR